MEAGAQEVGRADLGSPEEAGIRRSRTGRSGLTRTAIRQMKNADRIVVQFSSGPRHAHANERPAAPHIRDSPSQAVRLPGTSGTFQVLPKTCLSLSRQTGNQSPPSEPGRLGRGRGGLPSHRIRPARRGAARPAPARLQCHREESWRPPVSTQVELIGQPSPRRFSVVKVR